MKKILRNIAILLLISTTSVAGYAGVRYLLTTTDTQTVTVGQTDMVIDGLEVSLVSKDDYSLTYFDLPETDTSKHYITYVYDYNIIADGAYKVEVTSNLVTSVVDDGQLHITVSLHQDEVYSEGDVLDVVFEFSLVEVTLNEYTQSNPLNINDVTDRNVLMGIGFTEQQSDDTIINRMYSSYDNLKQKLPHYDWTWLDEYVEYGIVIFD